MNTPFNESEAILRRLRALNPLLDPRRAPSDKTAENVYILPATLFVEVLTLLDQQVAK